MINSEMQFIRKAGKEKIIPEQCVVYHGGNAQVNAKAVSFNDKTGHCSFGVKEINKERTFLLQAAIDGRLYKRYFKVPNLEKTFDVSFFPEGGYAPLSTNLTMAFKSINTSGLSEDVKGQVFDDQNQLCTEFESTHLGMGSFNMYFLLKVAPLPKQISNWIKVHIMHETKSICLYALPMKTKSLCPVIFHWR